MLTEIEKVRLAVADTDPAIPFLDDETYQYFLDKNNASIFLASLDAAKTILFILSQRSTNKTVDVLSISGGAKAAEQYRLALQLFLRDPYLNPIIRDAQIWIGNVSKEEMQANNSNLDNQYIASINSDTDVLKNDRYPSNPFLI
jgi:hypothetical protein